MNVQTTSTETRSRFDHFATKSHIYCVTRDSVLDVIHLRFCLAPSVSLHLARSFLLAASRSFPHAASRSFPLCVYTLLQLASSFQQHSNITMSANDAARFYWAKLRKATTIFEGGDLEQAQDICCQIGNDLRSPKFCQIEAWKLRSRCLPSQYDYWLAKSNLEQALGVCEDCKSDTAQAQAGKLDRKALAQIKKEVESMLQGRLAEYNQYLHDKGREPPSSQDELYDIIEAASDDPDAEEWYEVVRDEKGNEVAGPVSRWPFMGPGKACHSSLLFSNTNSTAILQCRPPTCLVRPCPRWQQHPCHRHSSGELRNKSVGTTRNKMMRPLRRWSWDRKG